MEIKQYWKALSAKEKRDFADELGYSRDYLAQIACGAKSASHSLAKEIEKVTDGSVTRHDLRPDIFGAPPVEAGAA